jgi:hypothetical protein
MALPGITCPEKYLVPLYFKPENRGELSKLFQKDSIFEHLWDPWRPDAVKAVSYEDTSLLKYMHSHFLSLKSPVFASLKTQKERFSDIFRQLTSSSDVYSNILQDTFMKNLNNLDNDIMISILKYYAVLEEHKRLSQVKYEHVNSAISLKRDIEKLTKKVSDLAASLQFETCGAIKVLRLDHENTHFSRCDKAVSDNIRAGYFKDSGFTSLKVRVAFKLENFGMLKTFEKKIKTSENCMLKGLFMSINPKQISTITTFGLQTSDFISNNIMKTYYKEICSLPADFVGKTKIEEYLRECEGFPNEINASTSSTLLADEKKLCSSNNCIIILLLCRSIISRNKSESGLNPETQEYKITDFSNVYPEYLLICTKEKNNFEVVPNKYCIIPVKLTDLNYSSPNSNKMSIEGFYSYVNKAVENSQNQRNKLKSEVMGQIEGFWGRMSKEPIVTCAIETKKKFAEKLRLEIEALRKDLATTQRFTESLRQIKNIRCKTLSP